MSLSPDDIAQREEHIVRSRILGYRFFSPLGENVKALDTAGMVRFGVPVLDDCLGGGLANQSLHLLAGYSHNGKTQMFLTLANTNSNLATVEDPKVLVLFSPDEGEGKVLRKLASMASGTPLEDVMNWSVDWLQGIARDHFPTVAVLGGMDSGSMLTALDEARDHFGREIDLVAFDYLERLSEGFDVPRKADIFKELAMATELPWLVFHQCNRSAGDGTPLTMQSLAYGGEQQADTIIGVWRQTFNPMLSAAARTQESIQPTVHVQVLKNKQTYRKNEDYGYWEGWQLAIEKRTGIIRPLATDEQVVTTTEGFLRVVQ